MTKTFFNVAFATRLSLVYPALNSYYDYQQEYLKCMSNNEDLRLV